MKNIYSSLCLILAVSFSVQAQFIDTAGMSSWSMLHNSSNTWMTGAFDANIDTSNEVDFGWGFYNTNTHFIMGDSIYIIKTVNDNYKAISIDRLAGGVYSLIYSDLDGSNLQTVDLGRSPYSTKNFFQYSLDNDEVKDLEPSTADWDIVFTKYFAYLEEFDMYYPSAGILSNRNVEVAQVEFEKNGSYSLADTANYPFGSDISTIGYDWKDAFAGIVYDTVVYFVKDQNGNINELQFTGYGGAGTGKMHFKVNGVEDSISLGSGNINQVYYSLENQSIAGESIDHDWDIALFAQPSFSAFPIRINAINGVQLYVYPNEDISYWSSIGVGMDEKDAVSVVSVYPNPARENVTLVLNAINSGNAHIAVLDQSGKQVRNQQIEIIPGMSEYPVNVQGLPNGFYFLQLEGDGYQGVHKLVLRN